MALSQGLQTIGQSVDSFKQLGAVVKSTTIYQKALTAATAVQTFVMNGATLAAKLLRGALISTGVGALVVGVGLLIANFDKVKKVVMNLIPGLAAVGDFVGKIVDSITDFVGATSDATRELDKLIENADKTLAINKKFLAEHGDQIDKYTKQKIDAKKAYAEAIKEEGANTAALAKRLSRELAAIDKQREDDRIKINQDAADKIKAANEKLAAAKKAADEKILSDKKAADAAYLKAIEDRFKKEQSQIDAFNQNINQLDAIQKEQDDKKLADEKAISDASIKIAQEQFAEIDGLRIKNIEREKAANEAKLALQNEYLNLASQGIKDLAGKNLALQKAALIAESAVAIARIVINTQAANLKAVAASPLTFGQPWVAINTISGVLSAVSTIAATKKALSALGGGSAPTAPSLAAGSGGATTPPSAPQFNVVGTSGVNQIAQGLGNQSPVQAYVIGSQVTTQQALDRNIIRTATLGG